MRILVRSDLSRHSATASSCCAAQTKSGRGRRRQRPSGGAGGAGRGIKSLLNEPVRAETDSWNGEERERERERQAKLNLKFLPCLLLLLLPSFLDFFLLSLPRPSAPSAASRVGSLIRFPNGVSAMERRRRPYYRASLHTRNLIYNLLYLFRPFDKAFDEQ